MRVTPRWARTRAKEVDGFAKNSCRTSSEVAPRVEKKQQNTRVTRRERERRREKHVMGWSFGVKLRESA